MPPFHTTRLVEFSDTDMAGIMHFSAYFHFMEAAEHAFLRSLGLSVYSEVDDVVLTFPRVSASCDYAAPIRWEDQVDVEVNVECIGAKSVTYGFQFSVGGRKVAKGKMTSVCCRVEHKKPPVSVEIPDEFAEKLRRASA
jgi:4-hydroxybenzoyl-CoA thioesterase/acyl-CoA thioester hydrolase